MLALDHRKELILGMCRKGKSKTEGLELEEEENGELSPVLTLL
jgi:hypothetical protein